MKKLFVTFLLLVSVLTLSAQSSDKYTGSLLWKVSGKGLDKPSYILGSHHLAPLSVLDGISGLEEVKRSTEQVAGELVMSDKAALQGHLMQRAMLPAGESYKTMLSESDYKILDKELKALMGAGMDQLGTMHPAIISMSASIFMFMKASPEINLMSHIAIDEQLQTDATNAGKSVIGLETIDDQIKALFDAEPIKTQTEQLVCSIKNMDFNIQSVIQLNDYYKAGQLDKMYDLSFNNPNDPCTSSEESQNALVRDRNDKWLVKIPAIMKDKPTLFVVGALHLAGEEGLLFQLDKMGYTIEAVK